MSDLSGDTEETHPNEQVPPALVLQGVFKRYGKQEALKGLDLRVPRGSIFGLIGPNGAGKTTTFSICCGYLRPDAGQVDVLGAGPFDPEVHRGRVTALPQDAALGRDMPVIEQLTFFAQLQGLSRAEARVSVDEILTVTDLQSRARDRVRTLSHGMMRRMGIGQAFLGRTELVLLDEPTNGLDPTQAEHLRRFIASQRGKRTLILSSHNLHEIERLCDHIALIDHGKVIRAGTVDDVTGRQAELRFTLGQAGLEATALERLRQALDGVEIRYESATRTLLLKSTLPATGQSQETEALELLTTRALQLLLAEGARIATVTRGQSLERAWLESV